jgi:hypothetical protein
MLPHRRRWRKPAFQRSRPLTPSPGPPRLMRTPAAGDALRQRGEGMGAPNRAKCRYRPPTANASVRGKRPKLGNPPPSLLWHCSATPPRRPTPESPRSHALPPPPAIPPHAPAARPSAGIEDTLLLFFPALRIPCHSERSEESRPGSLLCDLGRGRARFLASLGMTAVFHGFRVPVSGRA